VAHLNADQVVTGGVEVGEGLAIGRAAVLVGGTLGVVGCL